MKCGASARLQCPDPATAATVLAALAPENGDWVQARVEGSTLLLTAEADSPAGLRRTLEDVLACASAALKATDAVEADDVA